MTSYSLLKTSACYDDDAITIEAMSAMMQRPLLLLEEEDMEALIPQELQQEKQQQHQQQQSQHDKTVTQPASQGFRIRFVLIGVVVGLIVQAVSFGSFVFLLRRWGEHPQASTKSQSHLGHLFFVTIMAFSQLETFLYISIWIVFAFSYTRRGALYFQNMFHIAEVDSSSSPMSMHHRLQVERFMFVMSVSFFVGVVFGSFMVWLVAELIWRGIPTATVVLPFLSMVALTFIVDYLLLRSSENEEDRPEEESEEFYKNRMEMP
jgi:hypothetical protein